MRHAIHDVPCKKDTGLLFDEGVVFQSTEHGRQNIAGQFKLPLTHLLNVRSMYSIWGVVILALLFVYMWASTAFGIRFSNLTNRGILTNGPYRFCMHPAYFSKNLSWWLVSVPFISQAGPAEALRHSLLLLLLNVIYYLRAITEERHLSQDPNYVKYGLAMNKRSIFKGLFRIFPFLKYNPEKYLSQLEDYSRFTIPKTMGNLPG
ncbi:MAG: hypothetical protein R6W90_09455 [Ignavibacteriaceae bacterium]